MPKFHWEWNEIKARPKHIWHTQKEAWSILAGKQGSLLGGGGILIAPWKMRWTNVRRAFLQNAQSPLPGKDLGFGVRQTWTWFLAIPKSSSTTLHKSLQLWFLVCKMGREAGDCLPLCHWQIGGAESSPGLTGEVLPFFLRSEAFQEISSRWYCKELPGLGACLGWVPED